MIRRSILACLAIATISCDPGPIVHPDPPFLEDLQVTPEAITLHPGQSQTFSVTDSIVPTAISWSVVDGPGSISSSGEYSVPSAEVSDTVRFWIEARTATRFGRARVTIAPGHTIPACFERDVAPIIRSNCALAGCHDPGGREGGYDFTSYLGVRQAVVPGRPDQSRMLLMITNPDEHERMPPEPREPLSESQIETIRHWIADGALGAPCPGEAPCDLSAVTWSGTIRPILNQQCISCHAPGVPGNGGIDLTQYSGARSVALSGALLGSITHAPGYAAMPGTADTLENCQILQIRSWVDNGAPEN